MVSFWSKHAANLEGLSVHLLELHGALLRRYDNACALLWTSGNHQFIWSHLNISDIILIHFMYEYLYVLINLLFIDALCAHLGKCGLPCGTTAGEATLLHSTSPLRTRIHPMTADIADMKFKQWDQRWQVTLTRQHPFLVTVNCKIH